MFDKISKWVKNNELSTFPQSKLLKLTLFKNSSKLSIKGVFVCLYWAFVI